MAARAWYDDVAGNGTVCRSRPHHLERQSWLPLWLLSSRGWHKPTFDMMLNMLMIFCDVGFPVSARHLGYGFAASILRDQFIPSLRQVSPATQCARYLDNKIHT